MTSSLIIKRVPDDMGHFTALTPEVRDKYLTELAKGDWPGLAAFRAGIAPKSVKRWLDKGLEEAAIEPYASFAAEVVRIEADIAGQLIEVVMNAALGKTPEPAPGMRRPDPEQAFRLLQTRFRFFWGSGKDGAPAPAGVSIAETVERQMAMLDEGKRAKARELLSKLPAEEKQKARKEGFLL